MSICMEDSQRSFTLSTPREQVKSEPPVRASADVEIKLSGRCSGGSPQGCLAERSVGLSDKTGRTGC
jgi:hypothetical protein